MLKEEFSVLGRKCESKNHKVSHEILKYLPLGYLSTKIQILKYSPHKINTLK